MTASPSVAAGAPRLSPLDILRKLVSFPTVSRDSNIALVDWVAPLWPTNRPAAARIVTAGTHALTDVPDPFVSILGMASLRDLGQRMGRELSIHRVRGNLWIDGFSPAPCGCHSGCAG